MNITRSDILNIELTIYPIFNVEIFYKRNNVLWNVNILPLGLYFYVSYSHQLMFGAEIPFAF